MIAVATHSGPFHADDVMAVALVRRFLAPGAEIVRTRDLERIARCDLAVDVGGAYDPSSGRFDHHQVSYTGRLSSAGMIVQHLAALGKISRSLADHLQEAATDYIDDVDNGRVAPQAHVPCFPRIVEAVNALASTEEEFDTAFLRAVEVALVLIDGLAAEHERVESAAATVRVAMDRALERGSNLLELDAYINWKPAYFANGGEQHPTEFAVFPGTDGSWRVISIPPRDGCFEQKRPLPAAWAGLTDAALEAVTGVPGSMFCHKNRFIAVFRTQQAVHEALRAAGLVRGGGS